MSLHAHVTAELPRLRAEAERMMTDQIRFIITTTGSFDASTGEYGDGTPETVYEGKCQVQLPSALPLDARAGDSPAIVERTIIKLPVDAVEVPIGAVGEITEVGPLSDPLLVGRFFRVVGSHNKTFASARRLPCEEITREVV